jgi:hypothetical protein
MALKSPCDFAKVRYVQIGLLRNVWGWTVLMIGVVLAGFLIAAILLFAFSKRLPSIISGIGALVNGPILLWINKQRKNAADEDDKAFTDLERVCGPAHVPSEAVPGPGAAIPPGRTYAGLVSPESFAFEEGGETETAPWFQELQTARQSARAAKNYVTALRGKS